MEQMDQKKIHEVKGEYMAIRIPEQGLQEMQKRMEDAKRDKRAYKRQKWVRRFGAMAAAVLVLFLLPNTNADIARAMGNIPLLGKLFKVITIREYFYEDETHLITAQVPRVEADTVVASDAGEENCAVMNIHETGETIKALNAEITEYVNMLLKEFEKDMVDGGYQSLEIDYTTITDTEHWFTLEIYAVETAASGYEFRKYYHIDKEIDEIVSIKGLLQNDEARMKAVSEEILRQMQEQMAQDTTTYFMKCKDDPNGFEAISEDQNFYINSDGQLVIVFNEYDVAPGSAGCPEFVIPDEVWKAE